MSTITKLIVDVTAKGMEKLKGDSQQFHDNMVKGAAATKKAVLSASAPSKSVAAAKQESQDYGVSRSLRPGGTGAGARDFAQEAQGLGGLVRLYATYAANIFAVGAAFRALSNAMDTTNMVKGLDQLGAASGMALGTLSKRLVEVTDGAISLREAMESVAKASSSGMSSENILRMGKVAKQASQALGVDMGDAVNRITRGITKLEPELLDEIGIFTRVDSAVKEYAKSVGKSATALTDFERRMAFANAVLEEGERKFSAIDIDTNPYTKLSAAIRNAAQSGLELVNTVLAPIVNILSQSPTALMAILGSLGLLLVRQALPAIGEFKAGLASAAEDAKNIAITKAEDAAQARKTIEQSVLADYERTSEDRIAAVDAAEKRIQAIQEQSAKFRKNSAAKALLDADLNGVATLEQAEELRVKAEKGMRSANEASKEYAQRELEVATAVRENILAKEAEANKIKELTTLRERDAKGLTFYGMTVRAARNAEIAATKSAIVSNAAYTSSLVGPRDAFRLMRKEIADSGLQLGTLEKTALTARGGIAILGGAIGALGNALSGAFMWLGLITTVIGLLDAAFSGASKELSNFSTGVDALEKATDTLNSTMELTNSTNPFSVKSLEAQGTAMMEFSSSVDNLAKSAEKALKALENSAWDKFKDNVKSIWGGDVQNTFEDSLSESITSVLESLENSPLQKQFKQSLQNLLKIDDLSNVKDLEKALEGLKPSSELAKELRKRLKEIGMEASVAASKAREFSDSFKKADESFKAYVKQFDDKNPLTTWSIDAIAALDKLNASVSGPLSGSIDNLKQLVEGISDTPIFGIEASRQVASMRQEILNVNTTLRDQTINVQKLTEARQKQAKVLEDVAKVKVDLENRPLLNVEPKAKKQQVEEDKLRQINSDLLRAQNLITDANAKGIKLAAEVKNQIQAGIDSQINNLITQMNLSFSKGSTLLANSIVSSFGNTVGAAKVNESLQLQEIGIEQAMLQMQANMLKEQTQTKINTARTALLLEELSLSEQINSMSGGDGGLRNNLIERRSQITSKIENYNQAEKRLSASPTGIMNDVRKMDKEVRDIMIGYAQSVNAVMGKMNEFGQKAASIKFETTIKEAKERAEQSQKIYDIQLKSLAISSKELALNTSLGEEERVRAESALAAQTSEIQYAKEYSAISGYLQEEDLKIFALRKLMSGLGKESAAYKQYEVLLTSALGTKENLLEQSRQKGREEENAAAERAKADAKKLYDLEVIKLDAKQKSRDVYFEIAALANAEKDASIELVAAELERQKDSGLLSETDYLNKKRELEIAKEIDSLYRKMQSEAISHSKKIESLTQKLNSDIGKEAKERIQQEIDDQQTLFNARMESETNVTNKRIEGIDKAIEYEKGVRDRQFQKDISDGIMTALFEGGKAGSKKIRDAIVNQLRDPVQIVVNALINPITSAINTMVSGAATGLMNSAVSSIFGAGSTLTGVAGTFGKSIATGFTSTVQGWMGMTNTSAQISNGLAQIGAANGGSTAAGLGANIGTYLPYVAVAAIVLNVLGVFRKTKQVQSALTGMLGEGDIKDVKVMRKSGTLLDGPKYWVEELGINKGSSMIQEAFATMKSNTIDMAKSLGLATDQVKNFTTTLGTDKLKGGLGKIGLSLTGEDGKQLSEQEVGAKINEALATANNELAQLIIGTWEDVTTDVTKTVETITGGGDSLEISSREVTESITKRIYKESEYAKLNETAIETLTRLATSLQSVNGFFELIGEEMFDASLAGGDLASKLVDASGGLDKFNSQANFFFQNFYTEAEQFEMKSSALNKGLKRLADDDTLNLTLSEVTSLTDGVGDAKEEFKALLLAQDRNTEAGRKTYAALMDVAPAFLEVVSAADAAKAKVQELAGQVGLTAESLSQIIVDGYMNGVDGAQIGKMVANTIQRGVQQALIQGVAGQISSMISAQIVNPILQSIVTGGVVSASVSKATMTSVVDQARTMLTALAEVFNSPEFKQLLADLGNLNFNLPNLNVTPAYQYDTTSAEDKAKEAKDAAFKAMDDAFSALKKSVDAQKKLLQEQVKLAEDQIKKIEDLINVLDSNIKELRGSVTETAAMQAAQGNQFIQQALEQALATGVLPDSEQLSEAIGAVRSEIDLGNYDSKFAEDRAKLLLAGQLDQLKALGLDQKTDAELQLEALKEQITQLDLMLESYQLQIDAIKGVDSSVKTVAQAIVALEAAIAGAAGAGGSSGGLPANQGGGYTGGTGGTTNNKLPNIGFKSGVTKDYTGVYNSGMVSESNGKYTYSSGISDASGFSSGPSGGDTLVSSKAWTTTGYASNNPDIVDYYNANKSIIAQLGQASTLAEYLNYHFITYGIGENRKFAKGGIFDNSIVTAPTLFNTGLMGEAGPEAIMPLGKMPDGSLGIRGTGGDNAELIAEIKNLKAELTHMKQYVAKTSTSTEESRKLLDEVVRGGSAITVESEIASY